MPIEQLVAELKTIDYLQGMAMSRLLVSYFKNSLQQNAVISYVIPNTYKFLEECR